MCKRRSDAEVEDEVDHSERHHKRQKRDDHTEVIAYDTSYSTEASEEITTPATTEYIDALRDVWLEKERLRSDPRKECREEGAWARDIRNKDQVISPVLS